MRKIKIAYIGGGSTGWAWSLMSDLILNDDICGEVSLYDIDQQAAAYNAKIGNQYNNMARSIWEYSTADTLKEALSQADFIIISITPASLEKEMYSDVHHPEKFGIYQSVGDTVGPGGYIRALRCIPIYITIAKAIAKYAPFAWVINYTNPMSLCTKTLYHVFPQIKAFGCCHEVFSTQKLLANIVAKKYKITTPKRRNIKISVQGINHFTWIDKASFQGEDLFPIYAEFVQNNAQGVDFNNASEEGMYFCSKEMVKFDLFKRYKLIAAAGDRHLAEFFPASIYLDHHKQYGFHLTPVSYRVARQKERMNMAYLLAHGKKSVTVTPSKEEGVQQIRALLGLEEIISNVNLPNIGQVSWAPMGAIVETNAVFRDNEVVPVCCADIKPDVKKLLNNHVLTQEAFFAAYCQEDYNALLQAWSGDAIISGSRLDLNELQKLFKEMIDHTKDYLPPWLKNS